MRAWTLSLIGGGLLNAATGAALLLPGAANRAADHLDPPTRTDPAFDTTPDIPADIADVFAWYAGDTVKLALTFAGPSFGTQPAYYDRDVLYKILVSTAPPDDTPMSNTRWPSTERSPGTGIAIVVLRAPAPTIDMPSVIASAPSPGSSV